MKRNVSVTNISRRIVFRIAAVGALFIAFQPTVSQAERASGDDAVEAAAKNLKRNGLNFRLKV